MGIVFEKVCRDYLYHKNSQGELPILFTSIGRWWGTDPAERKQVEIDLIARDGDDYIACECKWKNEALDLSVLNELRRRTNIFSTKRNQTWYYLFSKSGFTKAVLDEAANDESVILIDLKELMMA
jgi:hypothetical protein